MDQDSRPEEEQQSKAQLVLVRPNNSWIGLTEDQEVQIGFEVKGVQGWLFQMSQKDAKALIEALDKVLRSSVLLNSKGRIN